MANSENPFRLVLLGSGRGSNARAILEAERDGRLGPAVVAAVVSDNPEAGILAHAREFGKPAVWLSPGPFRTKLEGEAERVWVETLARWEPDLVVLAGFMRVVKAHFLETFAGKIINLHPSLLPKYPGLESIRRALEAGDAETGCTVHWVTAEVDGGAILGQQRVTIEPGETLPDLEARVHAAEHSLLPRVIRNLAEAARGGAEKGATGPA